MAEKKTSSSRSKAKPKSTSSSKSSTSKAGSTKKASAKSSAKGSSASGKKAGSKSKESRAKSTSNQRGGTTTGLDKSVEHFRQSLEHSITLSRDRLQDVVDDAVHRGRMTRGDAEKMVSDIVSKGRRQTDTLLGDLERVIGQARKEVQGAAKPVRKQATQAARRARRKLN